MNLYELPEEIEIAMEKYTLCFDENGEQIETDEVVNERMKELEEKQNKKDEILEWIMKKRGNAESNKTAFQNEITRLNIRIEKEDKTIASMEKMIKFFLPTIDKPLTISNWQVSYRKSEKTIIEDKSLIPNAYRVIETITTEKIPLDPIKKAIKEGKKIPGAKIEECFNLNIK